MARNHFSTSGLSGAPPIMNEATLPPKALLSKVLTPIGALLAAMGVAHYAKANSDGDGPGKRKATMEMASGVATILVSVVLVASKETFAALIAN